MGSPFEGKLLVSDIDGTLLYGGVHIPPRNIEAIRRFQQGGGLFALATGRAWQSAAPLLELLQPKAPGIFVNGASLYDAARGEFVDETFLDPAADDFLAEMFAHFPTSAMEIFMRHELGVARKNGYSAYHQRVTVAPQRKVEICALPAEKYKVLWMDDPENIEQMRLWYEANAPQNLSAFRSCAQYFEIMPKGTDKGSGLCRLRELLGIPKEDSCAIGDYENDLAMLNSAGIAAAPSSGDESAKRAAQVVVGDCTGGAVADFINYLEQR